MKKLLLIPVLLLGSAAPVVNASGIPVVDIAGLTQMVTDNVQRAAQWAKEADQWAKANGLDVDKLEEYKRQGDHYASMVEGHYSFEDFLNDPLLNGVTDMSEWRDLYDTVEDIVDLREQLGISRDDDRFDDAIKKFKLLDRFYQRTKNRSESLQRLLDQFEKADTPAARESLANAIALEQVKIQTDQQMLNSLQQIEQQRAETRSRANNQKHINLLFGEGIPRS